jgi:hypothetical protein
MMLVLDIVATLSPDHSKRVDLEHGVVREHGFAGNELADAMAAMCAQIVTLPCPQVENVQKWRQDSKLILKHHMQVMIHVLGPPSSQNKRGASDLLPARNPNLVPAKFRELGHSIVFHSISTYHCNHCWASSAELVKFAKFPSCPKLNRMSGERRDLKPVLDSDFERYAVDKVFLQTT